jgi:hypothetical protein
MTGIQARSSALDITEGTAEATAGLAATGDSKIK